MKICIDWFRMNTRIESWLFSLSISIAIRGKALQRCRQKPLNLPYHPLHLFLISQRDHEELITLMEANDAVGEQPHAVEEGVAAEDQTYWRAGEPYWIDDLREHHGAGGATERTQQRRAHVLGNLPLKFNSLVFGCV